MATVLYIQASPRKKRSKSNEVADAFVTAYKKAHPDDTVIQTNVFDEDLRPFDGPALQAKYNILHGKEHTDEQVDAWRAVEEVIEDFKAADKYVFSVPMWNFGIPYRLKQYIDILVQPGYTFSYDPQTGYEGLVKGKPVFVAYARGGEYSGPDGEAMDYQKRYIEMILGFIGLTNVQSVIVQPTLAGGPDVAQEKLAEAKDKARELAKDF